MQGKIIILGKPNVGKSSLFNRLLRDKIAITSELEGTTRDINIRPLALGEGENAINIELCDSAGLVKKASGIFKNVKKMIFDFINENDLILYVVSAESSVDDEDLRLFRTLKNAVLVVNKIDIEKVERWEYNAFGAKDIFYVSSLHNRGIKQLKDFLTQSAESTLDSANSQNLGENQAESAESATFCHSNSLSCHSERSEESKNNPSLRANPQDLRGNPPCEKTQNLQSGWLLRYACKSYGLPRSHSLTRNDEILDSSLRKCSAQNDNLGLDSSPTAQNDNVINIGIIGRVNVGKSSILNALLGKERSLVSEIEGTTIDPVSDEIIYKDKILHFVDTAGIRRASKIEGIEKFALQRTKHILEQSNIVLLVLDSSRDFVELDEKISGLSQKYNLGIIILLNKWDIKCADFRAFSEIIKRKFAYLSYAPILTISALKMRHIDEIKECILRVWENFNRRIPTALLNSHIKIATQRHPLPSDRGKIVKIYYASQIDCAPPQIVLVMNRPRALHFSYKRYLVNYFRANFDFSGVPIVILSKGRGKDEVAE